MDTRIRGARRRAGGRNPSEPADETVDLRRHWRTTLAGVVVATMALGGMTALAASPAAADDAEVAPQSEIVVEDTTLEEPAEAPAEETTEAPAEEAAEAPAEETTEAPAEETTEAPAEETTEAPAEETTEAPAERTTEAPAEEAALGDVQLLLVPPGEEVVDKVEICHATASYKNPYVINEPAADGDVSGHAGHTGPIFFSGIDEQWGDIIPPFYYDDGGEEPAFFPGLNWDADGQAIYENDCVMPEPPEEPTLVVDVASCVEGGPDGQVDFSLGPLLDVLTYRITVRDALDNAVAIWTFSGTAGTVYGSASLPPGAYTITTEQSFMAGEWDLLDEQSFTVEECPPVLEVEAKATGCSLGDDGTALVSLSGLIPGEDYEWLLSGDDYFVEGVLEDVAAATLDVDFGDLPPGNYVFAIVWTEDVSFHAEAEFFVEPCEPDIAVVVTECPAYGDEGSALLKLSNLVEGVEYDVWVTAKGDIDGTVYDGIRTITGGASHTAEIEISPLAAGKDYTAWVYGLWTIPEFVEQPELIEEYELHASADFSLKPCPPAPAKPVKPAGLATTGTDDTGGLLAAALILFGLGGAALVARGRRQAGSHVNE